MKFLFHFNYYFKFELDETYTLRNPAGCNMNDVFTIKDELCKNNTSSYYL